MSLWELRMTIEQMMPWYTPFIIIGLVSTVWFFAYLLSPRR